MCRGNMTRSSRTRAFPCRRLTSRWRATHRRALDQLAECWAAQVPRPGFDRLCAVALGKAPNPGYEMLAGELRAPVGTLKSWVFRLRRDYYDAFRDAMHRHAGPEFVDSEMHYFQGLLTEAAPPDAKENAPGLQPPPAISR